MFEGDFPLEEGGDRSLGEAGDCSLGEAGDCSLGETRVSLLTIGLLDGACGFPVFILVLLRNLK